MFIELPLEAFFQKSGVTLDVRSPSEFQQGKIPDSYSLPLFTDPERALIGAAYKQKSQIEAINLGLRIIGPKLHTLVQSAAFHLQNKEGKILCWRGGMRSKSLANLLKSIGYPTVTLQGGYRSFRHWVLRTLSKLNETKPTLFVIGGLTGSGKTSILEALQQLGEQVINLEVLANHRGSVIGHIGLPPQPTQEQFENEIAFLLKSLDLSKPIWIEDESRLIGKRHIPSSLYQLMIDAPVFYIERPQEERLEHLYDLYGQAPPDILLQSLQRISKRLGGQLTQEISSLINQGQKKEAFRLTLSYYDKAYQYQLTKRDAIDILKGRFASFQEWAIHLKKVAEDRIKQ